MSLESAASRVGFLVCVVFVIERDGKILVLRRSRTKDHAPGEWETGSGGILPGETPQAAVVREALEETSLDVDIVAVIDAFHFYRGPERRETIGISFHCRARDGTLSLSRSTTRRGGFRSRSSPGAPAILRGSGARRAG